MMILRSEQIREKIKARWPSIDDDRIWPRGRRFKSFDSLDHLIEIVKNCSVKDKYRYVSGAFECEFFSTQLMASVWAYQYEIEIRNSAKIIESADPWFFGLCLGMRFKTYFGNHNVNIAMVGQEIALIDPTNDIVWKAEEDCDDPYFIFR